jgi:hypothetical protein
MKNIIQLHNDDNIVVALKTYEKGSVIKINDLEIELKESVGFGHKIAIELIPKQSQVLKYGLSIGSALKEIVPGEHVHSHNLKTDYIVSQEKNTTCK